MMKASDRMRRLTFLKFHEFSKVTIIIRCNSTPLSEFAFGDIVPSFPSQSEQFNRKFFFFLCDHSGGRGVLGLNPALQLLMLQLWLTHLFPASPRPHELHHRFNQALL